MGNILTSTDPTGPKSTWKSTNIQPAGAKAEGKIDSLSCATASSCVAGMNEWVNQEGGGTYLNLATTSKHPQVDVDRTRQAGLRNDAGDPERPLLTTYANGREGWVAVRSVWW